MSQLDELQRECEMLVALLKDRHEGLPTWWMLFGQRVKRIKELIDFAGDK